MFMPVHSVLENIKNGHNSAVELEMISLNSPFDDLESFTLFKMDFVVYFTSLCYVCNNILDQDQDESK